MKRDGNGYGAEELLPLAVKLMERYTSKESSSVPYETAAMLMEAVLYCLGEAESGRTPEADQTGQTAIAKPDDTQQSLEQKYQEGSRLVREKVLRARDLYEDIIEDFTDYGCQNYRDTITKGMPAFFVRYDMQFCPQNHILTLDYPLLSGYPEGCGINLIFRYLEGIRMEQHFLRYFDETAVREALSRLAPDYETLYLDNICSCVLQCALCCMAADRPVRELWLDRQDMEGIQKYFQEDAGAAAEYKIKAMIRVLLSAMPDLKEAGYFERAGRDMAVRIAGPDMVLKGK